ncbi:YfhO family protein [Anaeromyxobacter sp. Fw109-5]|uniref:YfhO family protein n=1 Tax=Anaeromyxobacter sp. (strain Fw109-5) TaxID=404589 RepID=UPI00030E4FD8|nr:YfhO family protein [Anaeromyxobacter sp. Fw109-5]
MSTRTSTRVARASAQESSPVESSRAGWAAIAGLVLVVLVSNYRVALLGETYSTRDALGFMSPVLAFLGSALRSGRIPEWCDGIGIGVPFATNPIDGVTYPPFWIAAFVRPLLAKDLVVLAHLLVAAGGAAALARSLGAGWRGAWLSGAAFVTCGYAASMPGNNNVHLLCWTPWVAWAANRVALSPGGLREPLLLAAALAMQIVVGEPAHLVVSLGLALVLLLIPRGLDRRRPLLRGALAMAGALPLSAATLLPALGILGWTTRGQGLSTEERLSWSMAPIRVLEWLWPGLLGTQLPPGGLVDNLARALGPVYGLNDSTWAASVYVGVPLLALVAWTAWRDRLARWLLWASLGFVVLALGAATPVHEALAALLPPLRIVRYPEKYLIGSIVLWCAMAGMGAARVQKHGVERPLVSIAWAGTALLGLLVAAATASRSLIVPAIAARVDASQLPFEAGAAFQRVLVSGAIATVVAAAFATLLWLGARARQPRFAVAAGLLLVAELVVRSWAVHPSTDPGPLETPPRLLAGLLPSQSATIRPRLWASSTRLVGPPDFRNEATYAQYVFQGLFDNVPMMFGFNAFPGHSSIESSALQRLTSSEEGGALLGIEYVRMAEELLVGPGGVPTVPPELIVARDAELRTAIVRVPDPRPRAFVTAEAFDSPRPCSVRSAIPEQVELDCVTPSPGYAVLLDAAAPGWTVSVDGIPAPIETADGVFRAVRVGAGAHRVDFRYRTPWLRGGAAIAGASWLAWLVILMLAARKHAAHSP